MHRWRDGESPAIRVLRSDPGQVPASVPIVPLDDPALFGHMHQLKSRGVSAGKVDSQYLRARLLRRPFDQQPFGRMRFGTPVVAVGWAHSQAANRD